MPWYLWVAVVLVSTIVVGRLAAKLPSLASWWSLRARRRRAERKWRTYARKIGKDWRKLTPREKLEAHGLPRDSDSGS